MTDFSDTRESIERASRAMYSYITLRESSGQISTNYTRKYAETQWWCDWEIVRELVQNSLDDTGTASIEVTPDGLVITDKGKGFNVFNLLMDTTTKSKRESRRFAECLVNSNFSGNECGVHNTSDFYSKIGIVMATITKVIIQENITVPPNVVWSITPG